MVMKRKMSGKNNPFYGKHHSSHWKKKQRLAKRGKNNPMYGKKHRPGTIQKMRRAMLKRLGKSK